MKFSTPKKHRHEYFLCPIQCHIMHRHLTLSSVPTISRTTAIRIAKQCMSCDRCGLSPLMKACKRQNLPTVRLLLQNGAEINLQSPLPFEQKTVLIHAVDSRNSALVHVILRHGASARRPKDYKYSPLQTAVLADRPDLCEMLLRWGAEVSPRKFHGKS